MKIHWGTVLSAAIGTAIVVILFETVLKGFLASISEKFE
jgi:hypothetical protein